MEFDLSTLEKMTNDFVNAYKKVLVDNDKVATGALVSSIHGDVIYDGSKIEVSIYADEVWKYVEYGRRPGRRPPMDVILNWIRVKGLPRGGSIQNYNRPLPTQKQLAFLISRKIGLKGIDAGNYLGDLIDSTNFYDKVKNEMAKMISKRLEEEIHDQIKQTIETSI